MTDAIAVFNSGSSSLKFSVFTSRALKPLVHGQIEGLGVAPHLVVKAANGEVQCEQRWPAAAPHAADQDHEAALAVLLDVLPTQWHGHPLRAVGHRIVHGGLAFQKPVRLDKATLLELAKLKPLAPLHQAHNLAPVAALHRLQPRLLQVGCFDTAFHAHNPEVAQRFALPRVFHDAGVRRYGFHGLSYEYIASRLPHVSPRAARGKTVALHLGNGASACAMLEGRSVASSMGFTALDGLPMGSRCGQLDPGVLLWLADERGMTSQQIAQLLYNESGLLGVSGISSDMRALLASHSPHAQEAVALYTYRIHREIGSLAAALGGLDALVFTAGIGEHAACVRADICRQAAWLGVQLDEAANAQPSCEAPASEGLAHRISTPDSPVEVWVIPTNEALMVAQHTRLFMG